MRILSIASLLFFVGGLAVAQDQPREQRKRPGFQGFGGGPVMPAELAEKLGLSAEQKDKIAKLQADFDKQNQEAQAKMKDAIQSKDREKIRAATQQLGVNPFKARQELETKVKDVLTEEQKKKFDEQRPQGRPGFGRPGFPGGPGPQPGVILPAPLQERLELTAEQKEKLAQLQKDVDAKLGSILTEEQKKRLDQLKQAHGRPAPTATTETIGCPRWSH